MSRTHNALIEAVRITNDDHGTLSAWLTLDYGEEGGHQGFGGYALYLPTSFKHHKGQGNYAGLFIWRCMEVAEVTEWNQMVGKSIRVRRGDNFGDSVEAIGHITKAVWFCPKEEFAALVKEAASV